ncbi:hypothetical protein P692DRAFT_201842526 [Suillus brevipes Sb2]|nr:hypothetical protein P692DRAFT_201842526 [Suillus brevipes Sb2]
MQTFPSVLGKNLYGSLAVEVNHHPIVLALEDMTGQRGTAENLVAVSQKALNRMGIGDGRNLIAVTTDNPTVMQSYRRKFQEMYPWVLVNRTLNTMIGNIMSFPAMKKIVTQTTHIVAFFNNSHYWGGQLNDEAKKQNICRKLKQNCESRFYPLILHCLSVLDYRSPLSLICVRPEAQKKTNNLTPVASDVITTVLYDLLYWKRLEQIVLTVKSLVDAIGNLESRQASLADCMLELLCCSQKMSQLTCDSNEHDLGFWLHAKSVFNQLAITQVANGRSFNFMFRVAMGIAKHWKWDKLKAKKLANNLQAYHQSVAPFAGAQADGLLWWKNFPINTETYPLKAFAITIHSIVGHTGDVERLFSDLGTTQSAKHCNLSVKTFKTLGKIRANLHYLRDKKATEADKSTRCHHAHMHTRDLEENFAWVPPLAAEPTTCHSVPLIVSRPRYFKHCGQSLGKRPSVRKVPQYHLHDLGVPDKITLQ